MELHALYGQEELTKARIARQRTGRAMIAVAAVGLAACVAVCCFATRQNQGVTLPLAVGISTLAGWIVIFLSHSRYEGAKARVRHVELMLTGPRERFSGTLQSSEEGEVGWVSLAELPKLRLANDMDKLLEIFLREELSEFFYRREGGEWTAELK